MTPEIQLQVPPGAKAVIGGIANENSIILMAKFAAQLTRKFA